MQAVLATPAVRERLVALASGFFPAWKPAEVDSYYAAERATWIPIVHPAIGRA